jgi:hypothetical protein
MASKEDLYVSIQPEPYRVSKLNVLTGQADLLNSLKHLQNLKVLARQKRDLKLSLHRNISTVLTMIESIKSKFPEVKSPKLPKVEKTEVVEVKKKVDYSKHDEIDDELMRINEKLRQLNG